MVPNPFERFFSASENPPAASRHARRPTTRWARGGSDRRQSILRGASRTEVARMRTREEIATTVRRLIHEKLEVKEFTDDTPFTAMGLD